MWCGVGEKWFEPAFTRREELSMDAELREAVAYLTSTPIDPWTSHHINTLLRAAFPALFGKEG